MSNRPLHRIWVGLILLLVLGAMIGVGTLLKEALTDSERVVLAEGFYERCEVEYGYLGNNNTRIIFQNGKSILIPTGVPINAKKGEYTRITTRKTMPRISDYFVQVVPSPAEEMQ